MSVEKLTKSISIACSLAELRGVLDGTSRTAHDGASDGGASNVHAVLATLSQRLDEIDGEMNERLEELLGISMKLCRTETFEDVAEVVRHGAADAMRAHRGLLYAHCADEEHLDALLLSDRGAENGFIHRLSIDSSSPLAVAYRSRQIVFVTQGRGDAAGSMAQLFARRHAEIQAAAAVPLAHEHGVEGVMLFTYLDARQYGVQHEEGAAVIAAHAALALERVRRRDAARTAFADRLRSLVMSVRGPLATIQVRAKALLEDAQAFGHAYDEDRALTILRNIDIIDRFLAQFLAEKGFA